MLHSPSATPTAGQSRRSLPESENRAELHAVRSSSPSEAVHAAEDRRARVLAMALQLPERRAQLARLRVKLAHTLHLHRKVS